MRAGLPAPHAPVAHGGGGLHVLLKHPGVPLVGRLAPGVEIKDAGYIVAPPSMHPDTGRRYEWEISPFETPLASVPAAWLARLMKTSSAPPRQAPGTGDVRGLAVLREIPSAEYVHDISGQTSNRAGYVRCPSPTHEDRTPSLRVYDTAEKGWYCYGCERGGSIIDFWALTIGYVGPLRGHVYLTLEQQAVDFYMRLYGVAT